MMEAKEKDFSKIQKGDKTMKKLSLLLAMIMLIS